MKIVIIVLCLFFSNLSATIINVPADQSTIQAGIDVAVDGDTILVQPGVYFENINYNEKNITVGSLFLTTQDTTYISQTVIDGNQNGRVVTIEDVDSSEATLCGFSITNGGSQIGGGVYINDSVFSLCNLKIINNSGDSGAGIKCVSSGGSITDVYLFNNIANYNGGAISCSQSYLSISNSIISQNYADYGGGIDCKNSNMNLSNVNISHNNAETTCGGLYIFVNFNNAYDVIFDSENRSNIHSNIVTGTGNAGQDIYFNDSNIQYEFFDVVVDTFSVLQPSVYYVYPTESFSFDILNSVTELINSDLYVSPFGDNSNSGLSANEPLLTVHYALSKIFVDEQNPHTIYLAPGNYCPNSTDEMFPYNLYSYLSLEGSGEDVTILDANEENIVMNIYDSEQTDIKNLTISNGFSPSGYGKSGGVNCYSSSPILDGVTISNNSGSSGGGMFSTLSQPTLLNVTISNNSANNGGGIKLSTSIASFVNLSITNNSAYQGGGILCGSTDLYLEAVTITNNFAMTNGAGIYISGVCNLYFSDENRCSIYSNDVSGDRVVGKEIYCSTEDSYFNVILDTFTVFTPTNYYAYPVVNYTFDILNSTQDELLNADLYVSPLGSNSNSGLNENEPLLTAQYALSRLYVDEQNPHTIFFAPGVYSPLTTGEIYPLDIFNNISLEGTSATETILDAISTNSVIGIHDSENTRIRNLTITNGSSVGGAGIECDHSNPTLENLVITNNSSVWYGGGINCSSSSPTIINTTICNNSAIEGGGIRFKNSNPELLNVLICNNNAFEGGGMYCKDSTPTLVNVLIESNSSEWHGGGIYSKDSNSILTNVTVTGNSSDDNSGGIYCRNNSEINLVDCIMWNNPPQEVYFNQNGDPNTITVSYSDIQDGIAGIVSNNNGTVNWLNGNLDEDPMFNGFGNHPYSLTEFSPCIDAGIPDTTGFNLPEIDIIGNLRIWDGDGNGSEVIDMGAYEYGAQLATGFITGFVENTDGEPLENAEIIASFYSTTTGTNGEYELEVEVGNYFVSCTLEGYIEPDDVEVTVSLDETSIVDFVLELEVNADDLLLSNIIFSNYPNPFNPSTTIEFSLPNDADINISIFNIKGQKIKTLANNEFTKGSHSIVWNGKDEFGKSVSSGIFYYKLKVNGKTEAVKKCLLLK